MKKTRTTRKEKADKEKVDKEMLPEYRFDYSKARPNRFAASLKGGRRMVVLEPDVADLFATSESVNAVLRALMATMPLKPKQQLTWLSAIHKAANEQNVPLPPFSDQGMGSLICRKPSGNRFVSLKRRLVTAPQAEREGVEWTLWCDEKEQPIPVAVFREPLHPTQKQINFILYALKGWLIDEWSVETAQQRWEGRTEMTASKKPNY